MNPITTLFNYICAFLFFPLSVLKAKRDNKRQFPTSNIWYYFYNYMKEYKGKEVMWVGQTFPAQKHPDNLSQKQHHSVKEELWIILKSKEHLMVIFPCFIPNIVIWK